MLSRPRMGLSWCMLAMLATLGACAAAAGAAEEGGPQLTQIHRWYNALWALGIFGVLLLILVRFGWKPVMRALQDRELAVSSSIADAERRRTDSVRLLEEYQARLTSAKDEVSRLLEQAHQEAQAVRQRILDEARTTAQGTADQAQRQIEQAKREALAEVYRITADLAVEVAGKILQRELRPQDHQDLVRQTLQRLGEQAN